MKIRRVIILFSAAGLLHAETITNTAAVAMINETDVGVSLVRFDSSLGTLTGIHIEFITALYGVDYQFDNDSSRAVTDIAITLRSDPIGYFSTEANLAGTGISADGSGLLITAFHSLTLQNNDNDAVGIFNIGGTDCGRWSPGVLAATAGGNVDSSAFADYIGPGEFTSTINSLIAIGYTDFSGVQVESIFPVGEFSATVVYEYAIPEPVAIGLIGLGGIITLAANRLKRNRPSNG